LKRILSPKAAQTTKNTKVSRSDSQDFVAGFHFSFLVLAFSLFFTEPPAPRLRGLAAGFLRSAETVSELRNYVAESLEGSTMSWSKRSL